MTVGKFRAEHLSIWEHFGKWNVALMDNVENKPVTVENVENKPVTVQETRRSQRGRNLALFKVLGPGLVAGASDDDPSGIGTYSQAGAQLGFSISWTMLFSYPLMVGIQEISARLGRTTGRGIGGNICRHYPRPLVHTIVVLLLLD